MMYRDNTGSRVDAAPNEGETFAAFCQRSGVAPVEHLSIGMAWLWNGSTWERPSVRAETAHVPPTVKVSL